MATTSDQARSNPVPKPPWEGGCRCGRVRFRIAASPVMEMACHCRGCQRMTASAFSTTIMVPASSFAVIAGETVVGGAHAEGQQYEHHHCQWCKSWLFTTGGAPGIVNVRATLLDDPAWFAPWAETQTAEKLAWAETGAGRSFERFPDPSEFASLLEDYRRDRTLRP
jgi:hypothetical protein